MPDQESFDSGFQIVPSTKVAALLKQFPQLEDVLIGLAPPFQKLKNPVLRKTVARVASLQQVAAVGHLPVRDLVNKLRVAVGQPNLGPEEAAEDSASQFGPCPNWFNISRIVATIDERYYDRDSMPVVGILQRLATLQPGDIVELITTFLPAPGIDILRKKKLLVWAKEDELKLIRTYVTKPGQS